MRRNSQWMATGPMLAGEWLQHNCRGRMGSGVDGSVWRSEAEMIHGRGRRCGDLGDKKTRPALTLASPLSRSAMAISGPGVVVFCPRNSPQATPYIHISFRHEGRYQAMDRRRSVALGHARRRCVWHLSQSLRQHMFAVQIPRRGMPPSYVSHLGPTYTRNIYFVFCNC